ncbi:hypothetical protein LTR94_033512, partial [Friedmanniomyces endolithicus]
TGSQDHRRIRPVPERHRQRQRPARRHQGSVRRLRRLRQELCRDGAEGAGTGPRSGPSRDGCAFGHDHPLQRPRRRRRPEISGSDRRRLRRGAGRGRRARPPARGSGRGGGELPRLFRDHAAKSGQAAGA